MERTLCIIKPDAVKENHIGDIIHIIEREGFLIGAMEMLQLTKQQAENFYAIHKERPFFQSLVQYMTSGPVVVLALFRENAVTHWRNVIGSTNPMEADYGTIRRMFGKSIEANAVHGSDSIENGEKETDFFFKGTYLLR
ncbi:MAG: nucleoside-diphosphate kinase [bacterium]|nr:nucleoside-diphosphate kinase [bacterium]